MSDSTKTTKEYFSVTISDGDGENKIKAMIDGQDTLVEGSDVAIAAVALWQQIQSGFVDERLDFDPEAKGEATIVVTAADDGTDELDLDLQFEPTANFETGKASGAQALALSSLTELQSGVYSEAGMEVVDVR